MRVLITGANGLLGRKLLSLLHENPKVELYATVRSDISLPFRATYKHLDITCAEDVNSVLSSVTPDVIINTAAMTQVDECELNRETCWRVNAGGVRNLIHACHFPDCHFIQLSTDFIFDGKTGPLAEDAVAAPVNYYGESKLAAEKLLMQSDLHWCIVRTVLVYGITQDMSRSNIILWVKKNLEERKDIRVVNDQWRTPTLAEDLAAGCWEIARNRVMGIFHLSGKDFLSPYEIALKTAAYYHLDAALIHPVSSNELNQSAKRPLTTGFIIDKARRVLGYAPHSFDEGISIMARQLNSMPG